MKSFLLPVLLAVPLSTAFAQQASSDAAPQRVEVSNTRDPELRSYTQMAKGLQAERDKHQLAPDSTLYFILIPKSSRIKLDGLTMRLASDDNSIPIPIDADGKFHLPLIEQARDGEYDLLLNKPKGQFLIRPYVKSPNLAPDAKRLGDLRLECEVRWAIERQDVSTVFRIFVKALGTGDPCTSRAVAVGFYPPPGIDTVALDTPAKAIRLNVSPDKVYALPLWDAAIRDDSLIRYERHGVQAAPAPAP